MDIIYLHNLHVEAVIGLYEWERRIQQTLIVDLDMGTDIRPSAASDDVNDTVDYKSVAKRVVEISEQSNFGLVEALAEKIAQSLLTEFNLPWLRLKINKQGAVSNVRDVGIIIERSAK